MALGSPKGRLSGAGLPSQTPERPALGSRPASREALRGRLSGAGLPFGHLGRAAGPEAGLRSASGWRYSSRPMAARASCSASLPAKEARSRERASACLSGSGEEHARARRPAAGQDTLAAVRGREGYCRGPGAGSGRGDLCAEARAIGPGLTESLVLSNLYPIGARTRRSSARAEHRKRHTSAGPSRQKSRCPGRIAGLSPGLRHGHARVRACPWVACTPWVVRRAVYPGWYGGMVHLARCTMHIPPWVHGRPSRRDATGRIRLRGREGILALPPSHEISLRARQGGPPPMAADLSSFTVVYSLRRFLARREARGQDRIPSRPADREGYCPRAGCARLNASREARGGGSREPPLFTHLSGPRRRLSGG